MGKTFLGVFDKYQKYITKGRGIEMKKICKGLLFLSILIFGFIDFKWVAAKSVDISNTEIINYQYPGIIYGTATVINEYGTVIYDSSGIDSKYQVPLKEAISSWNTALGKTVLIDKNEVNAPDDLVDLSFKPTDGDSYSDAGYSGLGWGNSLEKIFINNTALRNSNTGPGTKDYVQLVSTIRHEIGHALGLKHDNGLVMADLYDAQINNNATMLASAQEALNSINKGILPPIPLFNKYAILNILNNREKIYYLNNHRSNQIASIFLDSPYGKISGVKFINITQKITQNYNLYKLSVAPKDPYVGTTLSNNLIGTNVNIKEDLTSVYGFHYYLFEINGEEFILNSGAFS